MAIDEAKERGQQSPLRFRLARADLGRHKVGKSASEIDRSGEFLVLPSRGILRLAADSKERAAASAADVGFLLDERRIELAPLSRCDLDELHGCPLSITLNQGSPNTTKNTFLPSNSIPPS